MKTGDPKQAIILAIVAVGAVGFLFMQLKGKGSPIAASGRVASVSSPAGDVADGPELPHSLYGDPFSHPVLAKLITEMKHVEPESEAESPKASGDKIPPAVPSDWDNIADGPLGKLHAPFLPKPSPEHRRHPKVGKAAPDAAPTKLPSLTLSAIVSATHRVALISIGDAPAQECAAGQALAPGLVLKSIADDHVVIYISGSKKSVSLSVGAKLQP